MKSCARTQLPVAARNSALSTWAKTFKKPADAHPSSKGITYKLFQYL